MCTWVTSRTVNGKQSGYATSLPEPGEEVWRGGDQVDGIHRVSDHLGDGPGEQQQGEAEGELRGRQHVQDQPGHIHPGIVGSHEQSVDHR